MLMTLGSSRLPVIDVASRLRRSTALSFAVVPALTGASAAIEAVTDAQASQTQTTARFRVDAFIAPPPQFA
jgi:hypothetical protein